MARKGNPISVRLDLANCASTFFLKLKESPFKKMFLSSLAAFLALAGAAWYFDLTGILYFHLFGALYWFVIYLYLYIEIRWSVSERTTLWINKTWLFQKMKRAFTCVKDFNSSNFFVQILICIVLLFLNLFVSGESRLAALQALGGCSALYCVCLAGNPFEKEVTFSAFNWTSFFLSLSSSNYWGAILSPVFLLLQIKKKNIDLLFLQIFLFVHLTFTDMGLQNMSIALFSELTFLNIFINPRSQKNVILVLLLFGLGGLQALTQSPFESWLGLFFQMSESFILFPIQGSAVLFFLCTARSLRQHLAFHLFYLGNGSFCLLYFHQNTQLARAFLSFFLFLHFILVASVVIKLKRQKQPISDFPESWNQLNLSVKVELISVLYLYLLFYFQSFFHTTDKFIVGASSLVIQIVILFLFKKFFQYWGGCQELERNGGGKSVPNHSLEWKELLGLDSVT